MGAPEDMYGQFIFRSYLFEHALIPAREFDERLRRHEPGQIVVCGSPNRRLPRTGRL
jgi:hypothetical protein